MEKQKNIIPNPSADIQEAIRKEIEAGKARNRLNIVPGTDAKSREIKCENNIKDVNDPITMNSMFFVAKNANKNNKRKEEQRTSDQQNNALKM